jgi:hypothetical protein
MSYTYLLEQGEEYSAASFSDIPPSVLSNLNLIAEKSCSKGSGTESCQSSQSGTMSPPSTANLGAEKSISFAEDSLAKTFQVRGGGQELRKELEADYGIKWQGLLVRSDQDLFSSKIVLCSEKEDSIKFCEALPKWGMMLDGECWAQEMSEGHIDVIGVGYSLPTPTATDYKRTPMKMSYAERPQTIGVPDDLAKWVVRQSGLAHARLEPSLWEWAMGWPDQWTDSKPVATDKFRLWLQRHSAFLATEDEMT